MNLILKFSCSCKYVIVESLKTRRCHKINLNTLLSVLCFGSRIDSWVISQYWVRFNEALSSMGLNFQQKKQRLCECVKVFYFCINKDQVQF